ncbi:HIT family protein [Ornithinimicrobium cavernae]|uniref:HIT family protein n=1 Tax=Ornithinimicrobium cavernae TaxID=2666047 RepID=UPI000D69605A|nr:HIT family protein [Ornithinimicrobium cavernae]
MANPGCAFCAIVRGEDSAEVVLQTREVVAFLDRRPVFKGHVLVVPREHIVTLTDLPDELLEPLFAASRLMAATVRSALGSTGSFVAMNNVVSQSVPHLHVHVVPRTKGDGLRGFFWPRTRYADGEITEYADRLRAALAATGDAGPVDDGDPLLSGRSPLPATARHTEKGPG